MKHNYLPFIFQRYSRVTCYQFILADYQTIVTYKWLLIILTIHYPIIHYSIIHQSIIHYPIIYFFQIIISYYINSSYSLSALSIIFTNLSPLSNIYYFIYYHIIISIYAYHYVQVLNGQRPEQSFVSKESLWTIWDQYLWYWTSRLNPNFMWCLKHRLGYIKSIIIEYQEWAKSQLQQVHHAPGSHSVKFEPYTYDTGPAA